jgi:mannose-6-phosphate isomerase-like protein (cupin superfamily)
MTRSQLSTVALILFGVTAPAYAFEPFISPADQHATIQIGGDTHQVLATREQTDGQLGIIILTDVAGGGGPGPAIVHSREAEFWYVLEGTYEFHVGDRVFEGGPGTFVAADAGQPHGFITRSPGRLLTIFSPGGYEDFFKTWAELGLLRGPELGKLENSYGVTRP